MTNRFNKPFVTAVAPKDIGYGQGWCRDMDRSWTNGYYAVMARDIKTAWGMVTHMTVRNRDGTEVGWSEKQRIKNILFGVEATAVEVYPAQSKLVDAANMYHLWILHDTQLPFCLRSKD